MLADDCRQKGTRGRLGIVLSRFLHDLLPDDAHERCKDKIYVSITPLPNACMQPSSIYQAAVAVCKLLRPSCPAQVAVTRAWPRPMGYLVSQFESREDLIEALLTSCHIPWWYDSLSVDAYPSSSCE